MGHNIKPGRTLSYVLDRQPALKNAFDAVNKAGKFNPASNKIGKEEDSILYYGQNYKENGNYTQGGKWRDLKNLKNLGGDAVRIFTSNEGFATTKNAFIYIDKKNDNVNEISTHADYDLVGGSGRDSVEVKFGNGYDYTIKIKEDDDDQTIHIITSKDGKETLKIQKPKLSH